MGGGIFGQNPYHLFFKHQMLKNRIRYVKISKKHIFFFIKSKKSYDKKKAGKKSEKKREKKKRKTRANFENVQNPY